MATGTQRSGNLNASTAAYTFLSVVLHALVAAAVLNGAPETRKSSHVAIELLERAPAPARPASVRRPASVEPVPVPVPEPAAVTEEREPAALAPAAVAAAPGSESQLKAYVQSIYQMIEREKRYPRAARLMHQEGEVELSFSVNRLGEITGVRASHPSAFASLNEEALSVLARIGKVSPLPDWVSRESLDLTITLVFRLR